VKARRSIAASLALGTPRSLEEGSFNLANGANGTRPKRTLIGLGRRFSPQSILRHVDPFLGNDDEIGKTFVTRQSPLIQRKGVFGACWGT
jgi:hypothetical protein